MNLSGEDDLAVIHSIRSEYGAVSFVRYNAPGTLIHLNYFRSDKPDPPAADLICP